LLWIFFFTGCCEYLRSQMYKFLKNIYFNTFLNLFYWCEKVNTPKFVLWINKNKLNANDLVKHIKLVVLLITVTMEQFSNNNNKTPQRPWEWICKWCTAMQVGSNTDAIDRTSFCLPSWPEVLMDTGKSTNLSPNPIYYL
jgi:hypothetical protein